ncbi:MFS transporter [Actinomadura sediminis]|uniref:Nitrate/nitrite transporter n=1 Tax=Actinomadura sediminis TaxID=1038904 RepID=A0ABW3EPH9_9ACTN
MQTARTPHQPLEVGERRTAPVAWALWGVGIAAYVVAILHRTSFGVTGEDALHRFGTPAGILATFTVVQLLVYAGLQVPVGLLLDRVGPRRMIAGGALLMAAGQTLMAVATSVPLAVGARVVVAAGDAMTFISVLGIVGAWFAPARVPVVTQLTGLLGQLGQILSAIPLVALLHGPGWGTAFGSAAALGVLVGVLAFAVLRDAPPAARPAPSPAPRELGRDLLAAWRQPGTRLGLWTHLVTQFTSNTFALMWGYPYLVSGQGMEPATASTLLTVFVLANMVSGPYIGRLVARHPPRRSWLVLGIVGLNAAAWAATLAWPPPAPAWLLVILVLCVALGAPGSMVGFDYARTFNPPGRHGAATGIVNVGGSVGALVTILLIGIVLDAVSPGGEYTPEAFRVAWTVQALVWTVGVAGVLRTRRLARRDLARLGAAGSPGEAVQQRADHA